MSFDPSVIESSFEAVKPVAQEAMEKFYEILWTDFPNSKALFENVDMGKQRASLLNSLVFVVENVRDAEKLKTYLNNMGARHVPYGVEEGHYDWVGQSLLKTFAFFFKEQWTEELETNWTGAYQAIASLMIEGMQQKDQKPAEEEEEEQAAPPVSLNELAHQLATQLFQKALQDQMKDEFYQMAREKAEELIRQSLNEVADESLKKAA